MGKHSKSSRREQYKKDTTVVNKTTAKQATSHLKEDTTKKSHKKKNSQKKKQKFFFVLLELLAIGLIAYSGYRIYLWYHDSSNLEQEINKISDIANISEIDDTKKVTVVESDENKENPYWDYIKIKLIDVDFSDLQKTNSDIARLDTGKWNKYQLSICSNN